MYDARMRKVMAVLGNTNKMLLIKINKALECSKIHSLTRSHEDLELLVGEVWEVICLLLPRETSDKLSRMS